MKKKLLFGLFSFAFILAMVYQFTPFTFATVKITNIAPPITSDGDMPDSSGCGGVERWSIKVFTDTAAHTIDFTPKATSITHLCHIDTPKITTTMPRFDSIEDSTYVVICNILEKLNESDSDCHLVLTDGNDTMIGEIPDPNCTSVMASPKVSEFVVCRHWVDSVIGKSTNTHVSIAPVKVTGVAFLDPPHNQTGRARNNVELHSIIDIRFAIPTSIKNSENKILSSVFPNPNSGKFIVSFPRGRYSEIEIYNVLGALVKHEKLNSTNSVIDMPSAQKGIYFYRILLENGSIGSTGKFIVE